MILTIADIHIRTQNPHYFNQQEATQISVVKYEKAEDNRTVFNNFTLLYK